MQMPKLDLVLDPRISDLKQSHLFPSGLADHDHEFAQRASDALRGMYNTTSEYCHAVALIGFSDLQSGLQGSGFPGFNRPRLVYSGWTNLGARTATFAAHDFDKLSVELRAALRKVPSWWGLSDKDAFKTAQAKFRTMFPDARKIRDASAHPETYVGNRNRTDQNGMFGGVFIAPGVKQTMLQNVLYNGVLTTTFDGAVIASPVHLASAIELRSIMALYASAVSKFARQDSY